jgi:hypothetical protein
MVGHGVQYAEPLNSRSGSLDYSSIDCPSTIDGTVAEVDPREPI